MSYAAKSWSHSIGYIYLQAIFIDFIDAIAMRPLLNLLRLYFNLSKNPENKAKYIAWKFYHWSFFSSFVRSKWSELTIVLFYIYLLFFFESLTSPVSLLLKCFLKLYVYINYFQYIYFHSENDIFMWNITPLKRNKKLLNLSAEEN